MISIPQNRRWTQLNSGKVFGSLYSTRNINFDEEGFLKLARKPVALLSSVTSFGALISHDYLNVSGITGYYMMTSSHIFYNQTGTINSPTDIDGSGHNGGINNDGLIWQQRWYISQSSSFSYYGIGPAWTTGLGSLTSGNPHPLCVFTNLNNLTVGDGNQVKLYSTSHSLVRTLDLPSNFEVRWMVWRNNNLYIGTRNISGGKAMLFVWDGSSSQASGGYEWDGAWFFSGCRYGSSIALMSSNGQLVKFNGAGFDVLASLPVYYSSLSWYDGQGYVNGRMAHRGMVADGDVIYLNIDTTVAGSTLYLQNSPGGLWQYDPQVGLYHKAGWPSNKLYSYTNPTVDYTTDTVTFGTAFTSPTGTIVNYTGNVGGLVTSSIYFIIRMSSTSIKLARTYADAITGTAIDITSNGSSSKFTFQENDEAGRVFGSSTQVGAVALISDLDADISTFNQVDKSTLIYGNRIVDDNQLASYSPVLASLAVGFNVGNFTTQRIFSANVTEAFSKLIEKFSRLWEDCDSITVKYRTKEGRGMPIKGIGSYYAMWVTSTQFTTTQDLRYVMDGDEIEFIDGRASGYTVHVSGTPTNISGTYTVNIDEALPNVAASDKSSYIIDNFRKINQGKVNASSVQSIKNFAEFITAAKMPWAQFKFELRGVSEPTIEETQVINSVHQASE